MHFLKCSKCGHLNEVKTNFLMFCSSCNKKLDNNYTDWQVVNPDKTFDDFKQLVCISEEEIQKIPIKEKSSKPKSLKYWIGFTVAFAIFYAIGQFGGETLVKLFREPAYDKAMMEIASELNKTTPVMVDAETRFDNAIALPKNIFQYNYTLINLEKSSIDTLELKNYIEPTIVNTIKSNPQMKYQRDHKTTMNYCYKDKNGLYLFLISVTPDKYE